MVLVDMFSHGIKASELIKLLQTQIALHGDCECFAGGGDYPEGIRGIRYVSKAETYNPANTFDIG